jgi:hypothetical protein
MTGFNVSLFISIRTKAKAYFRTAAMQFFFTFNNRVTLTRFAYFLKVYYDTQFQNKKAKWSIMLSWRSCIFHIK